MAHKLGALLAAERRARIGDLLLKQGAVRISDLRDLLRVSEVTIRADLDAMASEGLLQRDRGGAVPIASYSSMLMTFEQRAALNQDKKRRIGHAAAQLVSPGDNIIMDAGTTVLEMAKNLTSVAPLTVVTHALNVATQVANSPDVRIILVGGELNRETISTLGSQTERNLDEVVVQKVFLGIHALELEAGATDTSLDAARVKQAMIRAARQVIMLVDSSKWDTVSFAKVIPLSSIQTIVTDSELPDTARDAIGRLGIQLILA
jgi:DeoR/GlpR family transcriptional regulator of sugar metabolism